MSTDFFSLLLLLILGFSIGVLSGCFGIGGAFILTPTLTALGMPITLAIGTGLAFSAGVSSLGSYNHFLSGNVSVRVTLYIGAICLVGIKLSQSLVLHLEKLHQADFYIGITYVVILLSVGIAMYNKGKVPAVTSATAITPRFFLEKVPPFVLIDQTQRTSIWILILIGLLVGFLQGFLGVGGGFILVPLFIWVLKMRPHLAIGTSLLTLLFTSVYATVLYFYAGKVLFPVACVLLLGSGLGVQVGIKSMKIATEDQLTKGLAVFIGLGAVGIILRLFHQDNLSLWYTFSLISFTTLRIIYAYFSKGKNVKPSLH